MLLLRYEKLVSPWHMRFESMRHGQPHRGTGSTPSELRASRRQPSSAPRSRLCESRKSYASVRGVRLLDGRAS